MNENNVHGENMGEKYNPKIRKLSKNPKNYGKPVKNDITVSESYTGPCGDMMNFFFKIDNDTIKLARFTTNGCACAKASASQTMMLIEGKPLEYAEILEPKDVDNALGGLPRDHKHCAELAIRTLRKALDRL